MQRKAQGLSLNTMVIAAIVLIVLFVLVGILYGFFYGWFPDWDNAVEKECGEGFEIKKEIQGCGPNQERVYKNFGEDFEADGNICCQPVN